ncbi:MAG: VacJ family lipoprotein [Gemmobacter sp.]
MLSFHPLAVISALLLVLAGCSAPAPSGIFDPYEEQNRRTHAFNVALDRNVARPVSRAFGGAGGGAVSTGFGNVGRNLSLPSEVLNKTLQGRFEDAVHNAWRLVVNTTIGVGGLFDPATAMGLDRRKTDFGETLHVWGMGEGAYLELPVLGPSTERDMLGRVADAIIDPLGAVLRPREANVARAVKIGSKLGDRARFGDSVDSILYESADSYAQLRLLYLQNRRFELGQEAADDEFLDPYAD